MRHFDVVLVRAGTIVFWGPLAAATPAGALAALEEQRIVHPGDQALAGVAGFPPLWYACTGTSWHTGTLEAVWRPILPAAAAIAPRAAA